MKKLKLSEAVLRIVGLVLFIAGLMKLNTGDFYLEIDRMLGSGLILSPIIGSVVLSLELIVGARLFLLPPDKLEASVAVILFTVFLILNIVNAANGQKCSCFGTFWVVSPQAAVVRSLVLLVATIGASVGLSRAERMVPTAESS